MATGPGIGDTLALGRDGLAALLDAVRHEGFLPLGPQVRDGALVYDELASLEDLPAGWHDEQAPGRYRLSQGGDGALFGYAVGPHSWKRWLLPPALLLWRARRDGNGFRLEEAEAPPRLACFGVRPCELQAIARQDRVLLHDRVADPHYRARRERLLLIAANCTAPAGTCFCASMGCGPRATEGFDLALTELPGTPPQLWLVEVGSQSGARLAAGLPGRPARPEDTAAAAAALESAARRMGRQLDTQGLAQALHASALSPRWEEIGRRCLGCANCTLVCPTCFCTTVEDQGDLSGAVTERVRRWDSCFTIDFSYIHGGSVRTSAGARYRQWLTHKLAAWHDQFGSSGCVGCGRCITWCPVGIDITQEAGALRARAQEAARTRNGAPLREER